MAVFYLIRKFSASLFLSSKKAPKGQGRDAHERVRKVVAKRQRHPLGAAKFEFLLVNLSRESVRNSNFVLIRYFGYSKFQYISKIIDISPCFCSIIIIVKEYFNLGILDNHVTKKSHSLCKELQGGERMD